ncbi:MULTISPECIES: FKBP-type peptidyl-prolyl cis-trans isomerase [Kosmotoga]|jgi:peptidylprolyl isomerase|uniref:Peptidyl-prolyl cis-trans isomerase n=1 Tax=Kosmotoga olearia (strain ATCC BAA-1733 / DSM 21960 / TBF 19.5.1) TaxID=521045 RepID=C5CFT7_KOSOT|nr:MULTISPECIES: peptidylprolyl isomerase [Kosmotoga]ACR80431.1 peptidylprolyl isomerase FKBP-type [Kosmotoga olearia TBF 19.5.1]MDI3523403.1 hypothetical protein [Kosmotoga sp.]MDK2952901.1 hypothetical protein [Kosmotoga sp.]
MPEAKKGDTVKVHYTGRFEDGEIFDSSTGKEPLEFTIGKGEVIPGFEEAIIGMNTGESKTVKIPPEKAYGPRYDELVLTVERSRFPDDMEPQLGQQLQLRQPDGRTFIVTITDINETAVTLDANHPLAGKDLVFEINLIEIV